MCTALCHGFLCVVVPVEEDLDTFITNVSQTIIHEIVNELRDNEKTRYFGGNVIELSIFLQQQI